MKLLISIISSLIVITAGVHLTIAQEPFRPQKGLKKVGPESVKIITSELSGVVTDKSGAVVPGVEVMLKLPDGTTRTTFTDAQGRYRFAKVTVGAGYSLRFYRPGFRLVEQPNI